VCTPKDHCSATKFKTTERPPSVPSIVCQLQQRAGAISTTYNTTMAKKKKTKSWSGSEGRNLLQKDVKEGRIPKDMTFETAFPTRPEFCVGEMPAEAWRLFEGRLKAAREHVDNKDACSDEEYWLFLEDRSLHPAPPFDSKGLPCWQGSAAELFLLEDVKDSKHLSMSKKEFYRSRPAYHTNYPQQYITK